MQPSNKNYAQQGQQHDYFPRSAGAESSPLVWKAVKDLQMGFNGHHCSLPSLIKIAQNLERTLENTRQMYNGALQRRDESWGKLIAAQNNLTAVERLVNQYAVVTEPVVASDGYTYERKAICQYLSDCAETNTKAYSHRAKEELLEIVVPNQTLLRLVHVLQAVRPGELPAVSQRAPISPVPAHPDDAGAAAEDDALAPIRVSELEASLVGAVHAVGGGATQSHASATNQNNSTNSANATNATNNAANNAGATNNAPAPVPAPAPAANHANSTGNNVAGENSTNNVPQRRWETRGPQQQHHQQQQQHQHQHGSDKSTPKTHPCVRVYGRCNFLDDCAFAHYPYEACLNYIKGKCRFGQYCKEYHVNGVYPSRFPAQRGMGNNNLNNSNSSAVAYRAEEKEPTPPKNRKAAQKEKGKEKEEESKTSSVQSERNKNGDENQNRSAVNSPKPIPDADEQQEEQKEEKEKVLVPPAAVADEAS